MNPVLSVLALTGLAACALLIPAAPARSAADLPLQRLQAPIQAEDQLRARPIQQEAVRPRVTAPPKPTVQTQVSPGVTFLHKEGSATQALLARSRVPGYRLRLGPVTTSPVTTPVLTRPVTTRPVTSPFTR